MYNLNDLREKAKKEGLQAVIEYLTSDNISTEEKEFLKEKHILSPEGYPCLSLIYSLVMLAAE